MCGILSAAHLASDTSPGLSGIRRLSLFVLLLFAITATIRTSIPLITTNSDTLEIFVALPLPAIVLVATVLLGFNTGILLTLTSAFFGVFVTAHIPTVQASEVVLIFSVLGSIFLGIAAPTESAAVGAIGALLIADMWNINKRYLNDEHFVRKNKVKNPYKPTQADNFILKDKDPNFRKTSVIKNVCIAQFYGEGKQSYINGIKYILEKK